MIPMRFLAPAAAALLLTAGAMAQPGDSEATATAAAGQPPGAETEKTADTADAPEQAPASAGRSPSDYRASEKISEDRPVSFPVDI